MYYQEEIEMFQRDAADLAKRGHWSMAERYQCVADAMKELQQYRQMGTLEEVKAAAEKQKEKRRVNHDNCGNPTIARRCPECFEIAYESANYCMYCGQKIGG